MCVPRSRTSAPRQVGLWGGARGGGEVPEERGAGVVGCGVRAMGGSGRARWTLGLVLHAVDPRRQIGKHSAHA